MRHTTILTTLMLGLAFTIAAVPAHAAIIIDSLDNSPTGTTSVIEGYGKAVNFTIPAGSNYTLTSIVIRVDDADGTENPLVEIWSDDGSGSPIGSLLETLSDPGTFGNGDNMFGSSGTSLQANETYWVVVRREAGKFGWLSSSNTSVASDIGATHSARVYGNTNPGAWVATSSLLNRVQVNAIPEPATLALAAVGLLGLRRRRRA